MSEAEGKNVVKAEAQDEAKAKGMVRVWVRVS